jgi:lipid II:glycine glycyltransferase (peptidoglycan interpeptide bridge formation enzyme)
VIADGGAVKQYFSRRAIVPGGVLLDPTIRVESLQELLAYAVVQLEKKAIYLELRNYVDYSQYRSVFESAGFVYTAHLNFHVATTDISIAHNALSKSKQRQLKTATQAGVAWTETTSPTDITAFYHCLQQLYRTKVRKPLFPIEFFEQLVLQPNGKLLVIKQHEKVIGGIACVMLPGTAVYEWFVCADETEKGLYPSVMATWVGIEYAVQQGIPRFDFMGAGKPDAEYGVREFKSKVGGELVEHGRFVRVFKPRLYGLGKCIVNNSRITKKSK